MYIIHAIEYDFKIPHHVIFGYTTDKLKAYQEAVRQQYKYILHFKDERDEDYDEQAFKQIETEYQNILKSWDDFKKVYEFFKTITRQNTHTTLWNKIYTNSYYRVFDLVFVSEITEMDNFKNYNYTYVGV